MSGALGLRTSEQAACDAANAAAMAEFNRIMAARREGPTRSPTVMPPTVAPPTVMAAVPVQIDTSPWNPAPTVEEGMAAIEQLQAHLDATRQRSFAPRPDEAPRRQRLREAILAYQLAQQAVAESQRVVTNSEQLIDGLQAQLKPHADLEERCAQWLAAQLQRGESPCISDALAMEEMTLDRLRKTLQRHQRAHVQILIDFKHVQTQADLAERERQSSAAEVMVLRAYDLAERLESHELAAAACRQELIALAAVPQYGGVGPMMLPAKAYALVHSDPVNAALPLDRPDGAMRMHWQALQAVLLENAAAEVVYLPDAVEQPPTVCAADTTPAAELYR